MIRDYIIDAIIEERRRQDALHIWTKKTPRLAVLLEEVGEIAQALQGEGNLEEELIQVAAVCIRWLDDL